MTEKLPDICATPKPFIKLKEKTILGFGKIRLQSSLYCFHRLVQSCFAYTQLMNHGTEKSIYHVWIIIVLLKIVTHMCELLGNSGMLLLVHLPGLPLLRIHGVEDVQGLGLDGVGVLLDEFSGALQLLHHGPPRGRHQAPRKLVGAVHLQALSGHRV